MLVNSGQPVKFEEPELPALASAKNKVKEVVNDSPRHGVFYSDGGCHGNPGPAGWGLHGYIYTADVPKKGSGLNNVVLTASGYEVKANEPEKELIPVTPIYYVDGFGSFLSKETNNVGELFGAIQAIEFAYSQQLHSVIVRSDSKYVVDGHNLYVPKWLSNNWMRSDGSEPANLELWKRLINGVKKLTDLDVKVEFIWIRGHDGHLGNELADHGATAGCLTSANNVLHHEINLAKPDGYWAKVHEKHPFITHRNLYFNSNIEMCQAGTYYLGEHGDDDELMGKEVTDGAHAVVRLKEPDFLIELVRNRVLKDANGNDVIELMKLGTLYRNSTMRDLMMYNQVGFYKEPTKRLNYCALDRTPLVIERTAAGLSFRTIDCLVQLEAILEAYLSNQTDGIPRYHETVITPYFFDPAMKKVKKEEVPTFLFKPDFKPGVVKLNIDAVCNVEEGKLLTDKIPFYLGVDCPDRNALKRLESLNPKMTLITWMPSKKVFRYATIVECDEGIGIWAGMYTNMKVIV